MTTGHHNESISSRPKYYIFLCLNVKDLFDCKLLIRNKYYQGKSSIKDTKNRVKD